MKWLKYSVLVLSLLLAAGMLCACSGNSFEPGSDMLAGRLPQEEQDIIDSKIRIMATRDFGQEIIFDTELEPAGELSAMAALKRVAEVETAYGGGYVNTINGIYSGFTGGSKAEMDWFIYVNGIQCNVGALDYTLHPGDVEHWDFHDWSFNQSIPAIIGAYPEPFLHGYQGNIRPTLIVYSDSLREPAQGLESSLIRLGVNDVDTRNFNEITDREKEYCHLILVDTMDNKLISELNRNWKRMGFFTYTDNQHLAVFNARGKTAAEYSIGAGIIQATQNPWNRNGLGACENVAWAVTGTDKTGVINAIDALLNHHTEFRYAFAAVTVNGEIIRVPQ